MNKQEIIDVMIDVALAIMIIYTIATITSIFLNGYPY